MLIIIFSISIPIIFLISCFTYLVIRGVYDKKKKDKDKDDIIRGVYENKKKGKDKDNKYAVLTTHDNI